MWKSVAGAVMFGLTFLSLAAPAIPSTTVIVSAVEHGAVKKQKKQKKAKPAKPSKPAVKAPEKPKESWELPMKVVIVRSSDPQCEPDCAEWIMAEGKITTATPGVFRKVLKQLGKRKLPLIIQSPGGRIDAAMDIGRLIRKKKIDVAVGSTSYEGCGPFDTACKLPKAQQGIYRGKPSSRYAYCTSACPLILAAGTARLASLEARVGVHQIRTVWTREIVRYWETYKIVKGKKKVISRKVVGRKPGKSYTTYGIDKPMWKKLTAYLKEMGVAPALVDDMNKAPNSTLYYLSAERRKELALSTSLTDARMLADSALCHSSSTIPVCVVRKDFVPPKPAAPAAPDYATSLQSVGITPEDKPMTIAIVRNPAQGCEPFCPQWIAAQGVITADTPKLLAAVLAKMGGERLPVVFDSPGGDFDAALEMANLIRTRGLETIILTTAFIGCSPEQDCKPSSPSGFYKGFPLRVASCNGACLFAAIGGVTLTSDGGKISLHSPALYVSRADQRPVGVQLMLHFAKMGIEKELLARLQQMTGNQVFTLDESQQTGLLHIRTDPASTNHVLKPISCKAASPPGYCVTLKAPGEAVAELPRPVPIARYVANPEDPPGRPMSIAIVRSASANCKPNCPQWIAADGKIVPSTPKRLEAVLKTIGGLKLPVVIDSSGGDFDPAIEMGRMIRNRGLDVVVAHTFFHECPPTLSSECNGWPPESVRHGRISNAATCNGACVPVLASGIRRTLPGKLFLGVINPSHYRTATASTSADKLLENYLTAMGITGHLQKAMNASRLYAMTYLPDNDVRDSGLVTDKVSISALDTADACRTQQPILTCVKW